MSETTPPSPSFTTKKVIVSRFLKPEVLATKGVLRREINILNRLYHKYPSVEFWLRYEVGFALNCMAYFLTPDGIDRLAADWSVYHFTFAADPIDTPAQVSDNVATPEIAAPIVTRKKPRTIAELLSQTPEHYGKS